MAAGTDVTDEILDLLTTLGATAGVESVISYPHSRRRDSSRG